MKGHQKKLGKKIRIKNILKEVLYNSFAQALNKIFTTKHLILKFFLLFFVLTSSAIASFMVIHLIMEYFSYGVVTNTRTVFEIPTKFPQITICNYNMFTTEYALDFLRNFSEGMKKSPYDVNIFKKDEVMNISYRLMLPKIAKFYKKVISYVNSQNFSDENRKKLGHGLKDILHNCRINTVACDLNEFTWEFDPVYGNCYKFNTGYNSTGGKIDIKESNIAGPLNGLQFDLFVNVNEEIKENYYSYLNNEPYSINFNALGAIIKIDNSSYLKDHSYNGGIKIASGFHTDLSIYRNFYFNLRKPYSNCELDNDQSIKDSKSDNSLLYLFLNSKYQYTQQSCVIQCFQLNVINKCNCSYSSYFSLFNEKVCQEEITCAEQEWKSIFSSEKLKNGLNRVFYKDKIKNCLSLCPLECNQTFYETKLSFLKTISWKFYHGLIERNLSSGFLTLPISPEKALESFVSLNVFYESLSYSLTIESPQLDLFSLLASIGGNLGLILGVSLFSICELVEVLIEFYLFKPQRIYRI